MLTQRLRHRLSRLRWQVRKQLWMAAAAYVLPNCFHSLVHRRGPEASPPSRAPRGRVVACLRFRDEARFLEEWLEYHTAAGVDHLFLYNNFSEDNYQEVLRPYQERGQVTLIDWPRKSASPEAKLNCIARTRGRFEGAGRVPMLWKSMVVMAAKK